MLHVTNGDCAAERIRAAGVEGTILPWRDVLHDGPVPAGLPLERLSDVRAEFIGGAWPDPAEVRRSFAERDRVLAESRAEDEVVLWFEHDLYDQLQLLQVLDWFADHPHPRLTLINPPEYLGMMDEQDARRLFASRQPVAGAQLELARSAWDAFRGPDPRRMEAIMHRREARALPHLPDALLRLLQEYPWTRDGLSRSQRQALQAFDDGPRPLREAYPDAHHAVEDAVWMGDLGFAGMVDALTRGAAPLLRYAGDGAPSAGPRAAMDRHAEITDAGRDVLAGRADAVWTHGVDRWIGGVHLSGREVRWRWNGTRIVER